MPDVVWVVEQEPDYDSVHSGPIVVCSTLEKAKAAGNAHRDEKVEWVKHAEECWMEGGMPEGSRLLLCSYVVDAW
jgi:hypothetical protein